MASPATSVVLSSARQTEYLTDLTVIPVCFANILDTKLLDAPVSNKMFALAEQPCEEHHTQNLLLLSIKTFFCCIRHMSFLCKHPVSAESRSTAEGRYKTCKCSGHCTTIQKPSFCCLRTRPPLGTVKTQRKSFNRDMSIGIDCLVTTQT
jgi:hypothetical protein